MNALWRLNLPDKILNIIQSFYLNPQFRIKDTEGNSGYRRQNAGIRQGCPLSPYLFILVMHVMFHDINNRLVGPLNGNLSGKLDQLGFSELLYADDTMLVTQDTRTMNMLIAEIEK